MLKPVQLYNATEYAVARRQDALATLEMTRQVKKVGVITRSEAFHYVDQLRASDVRDDLLQIGAGGDKTAAGQGRWVPIHSALQPFIDRLLAHCHEPTAVHEVPPFHLPCSTGSGCTGDGLPLPIKVADQTDASAQVRMPLNSASILK